MSEGEPKQVIVCQNTTCKLRYFNRHLEMVAQKIPGYQGTGNAVEDLLRVTVAENCPLRILVEICFEDCFNGPNLAVNGRLHRPAIYPDNLNTFVRSLKQL